MMLALSEGQTGQFSCNILGTLEFLALQSQHLRVLIQIRKHGPIRIEGCIVVLHERLRHRVGIHHRRFY